VADVPVTAADFSKSRLGRTSRHYRDALAWARFLLRGSDLPTAAGRVPPLILNANDAFERFAKVLAQSASALAGTDWRATGLEQTESVDFLIEGQFQTREPDIVIRSQKGIHAIGDAKYKDVLERAAEAQLTSAGEVLRVAIQPSDWNQLYVYMRLTGASHGFFAVPFWSAEERPCELLEPFRFARAPGDSDVRVAVLAFNLLQPLAQVRTASAECLRSWLQQNPDRT
jgi:hypothetical protein